MRYVVSLIVVLSVCRVAPAGESKAESAPQEALGSAFLGRNIRLDFRVVPEKPDDQPMFLITAVPEFHAHASFKNDAGSFAFNLEGTVELAEGGQILVTYEAEMSMTGMDGGGEARSSSGVLLKPGEEMGVVKIGDKTLMIKATYADK